MENLFTGTTLLAALAYIGYQLKSFPTFIWGQVKKQLIYSVYIDQTSDLYKYLQVWLNKFHNKSFKNVKAFLHEDSSESQELIYNHHIDTFIIKYKGKKLLINKSREKLENADDLRGAYLDSFRIEGWRARSAMHELLIEVLQYNLSIRDSKQSIYTNDGYGAWRCFGKIYGKTIDNIICEEKAQIINDVDNFVKQEHWYNKRGIPYKRGFLFYGHPGNGKTSLCFALSKHLKRDIQFLNLNDIDSDSILFETFSNLKNNSILVLEDVDAMFEERVNGKKQISFSALLNCMDGAFFKYGVITIMTTNYIDKIDPALIREGRIDVKINIKNPNKTMVEEYLNLFYDTNITLKKYVHDFSMSRIQEICLQNKENLQYTVEILEND